jgi:integrase
MLNATQLKRLKVKEGRNLTKFFDGDGLYLWVYKNGRKLWRYRYYYKGKEKLLSLGRFPHISLKEARIERDVLAKRLSKGEDPSEHRKALKASKEECLSNSFEVVAREWWQIKMSDKSESHRKRVLISLEKDVFPWLGARPISGISAPELLKVIRRIEDRGAYETAHRVLSRCSQVFRFGVATGVVSSDPTRDLKGALMPVKKENLAAIIEPEKVGALMGSIEEYRGSSPLAKIALKLSALLFVRPGELRQAEWKDFDLKSKEWRYFVGKTKTDHIVPLSAQAMDLINELKTITGDGTYLFPSALSKKRPMSNNTVNSALRRMGYTKREMTAHGFRAMARTLLDEELKFPPHIIEQQLAHAVKDPLGRAYNRTTHLDQRKTMMQEWADYLDGLRASISK